MVCQYGSEITPSRKKAGGKEGNATFARCFHFTDIRYERLFCQMFQTNIVCLQLGLCLKAEIHELHSGFLNETLIPNYALMAKEEDTLITENSVTDLYKLLVFITLSF